MIYFVVRGYLFQVMSLVTWLRIEFLNVSSSVSGACCSHRSVLSKTYTFFLFERCELSSFLRRIWTMTWDTFFALLPIFWSSSARIYSFVCISARLVGRIRGFDSSSATREAWTSLQNGLNKKSVSFSKFVISK